MAADHHPSKGESIQLRVLLEEPWLQPGCAGRAEDLAPPLPERQGGKLEAGPTLSLASHLTGKPKAKLLTELLLLAHCG